MRPTVAIPPPLRRGLAAGKTSGADPPLPQVATDARPFDLHGHRSEIGEDVGQHVARDEPGQIEDPCSGRRSGGGPAVLHLPQAVFPIHAIAHFRAAEGRRK